MPRQGVAARPATRLEVCATASYARVQDAIDAAVSGDVIVVCAGTYEERLVVDGMQLEIRGEDGVNVTVIDALEAGTTLTVTGGAEVTVEGLTLRQGLSANGGGNINCEGSTLVLSRVNVERGLAAWGGGLAADGCTLSVTGGRFSRNAATGDEGGGGMFLASSTGTIAWTEVVHNTAYRGAGVYLKGDLMELSQNTISRNAASIGGGLFSYGNSTISRNSFAVNTASYVGGGAFLSGHDGEVRGNAFTRNAADEDGGGLYVSGGAPLVLNNDFVANQSGDDGGGLRVKLSAAALGGNTFTANVAAGSGGGAKVSHLAATIRGSAFSRNTSGEYGGALALDESATLVHGCSFESNQAVGGGALYAAGGWDPLVIEDSDFADNVASDRGGHVLIEDEDATARFARVTMARGTAAEGGAIMASAASLAMSNAIVVDNEASSSGGGIAIEAGAVRLANIVAWQNSGPGGSSLRVVDGLGLDVSNSVFGRGRVSAAVVRLGGGPSTWRYNDMYANDEDFFGVTSRGAFDGNLAVRPHFADDAGLDFSLRARSELIDAGNPWLRDPDGTRSDIGAFGGPAGSW